MNASLIIDIGRQSLVIVLLLSGPLLLIGLIVGLAVGVFQAVTQIHEMTLTFIPKILAITGLLFYILPWMIQQLVSYTIDLFNLIPAIMR